MTRHSLIYYFCLFFIVSSGLTACGSDTDKKLDSEIKNRVQQEKANPGAAADKLYNQATDALDAEDYEEAARLYEELERQYPYSRWATQAQLMAAYAVYADMQYERALAALDRFIELHPGHKDVDYAHYLKALSHYEQITDVKRDQSRTRAALAALNTIIRRFPESEYARDALYKRDLTLNHLAGKEMEIGRYYLRRNKVNAAINRFKNVVENYQTTTHVPEALHRLVEAYLILGLENQARRVAAVLGYNYPGSRWYQYSYRFFDEGELETLISRESWMEKTIDAILPGNDNSDEAGPGDKNQKTDSPTQDNNEDS